MGRTGHSTWGLTETVNPRRKIFSAAGPKKDRKFFEGEKRPYRFLRRSDGEPRHFSEERVDARPTGPAPRIEAEPPRVRGDAGSAIAIGLSFEQDWNLDDGYDLFGEDDVMPRVTVWVSHDLLSLGEVLPVETVF